MQVTHLTVKCNVRVQKKNPLSECLTICIKSFFGYIYLMGKTQGEWSHFVKRKCYLEFHLREFSSKYYIFKIVWFIEMFLIVYKIPRFISDFNISPIGSLRSSKEINMEYKWVVQGPSKLSHQNCPIKIVPSKLSHQNCLLYNLTIIYFSYIN